MGFCSNNCPPHKGGVYLFPYTQNRKKKTIKIKNPKNNIEKAKGREKKTSKKK